MDVSDVRSELQLSADLITDSDILYAMSIVGVDDIYLVCAKVLRMVLMKNRGRVRYKIGNYTEWVDYKNLRAMLRSYVEKSSNLDVSEFSDDEIDPAFTREGI